MHYFQIQRLRTKMKWLEALLKWAKFYERVTHDREYGSYPETYKDASTKTLNILVLLLLYQIIVETHTEYTLLTYYV